MNSDNTKLRNLLCFHYKEFPTGVSGRQIPMPPTCFTAPTRRYTASSFRTSLTSTRRCPLFAICHPMLSLRFWTYPRYGSQSTNGDCFLFPLPLQWECRKSHQRSHNDFRKGFPERKPQTSFFFADIHMRQTSVTCMRLMSVSCMLS